MKQTVIFIFMREWKKEFASRLLGICDEMRVPPEGKNRQGLLAKQFGVSQTAVHKWLRGESWPNMENMAEICEWAGINLTWLVRGTGEKYAPKDRPYDARIDYVIRAMELAPTYKVDEIKKIVEILIAAD